MIGTIVGERYRVLERIGAGGMGAIYAAEHVGTLRRMALKILTIEDPKKLDEAVQRFHAEARTASAIGSPHIVEVYDVGVDEAHGPFMAMELLDGEDLATLLGREGPLLPATAVRIVAQAAEGLAQAHEEGVVHRDIKPANLFLARHGDGRVSVKLLDFGIAKVRREIVGTENVGLTRTGSVLGTPMYMSPEQALGMKVIGPMSDVWSLGSVLYAALVGGAPFGNLDTLGKLILCICSQPIPRLQDRAPWVEPDIARIVHRALSKSADARYADAGEMLPELRVAVDGSTDLSEDMLHGIRPGDRARRAPELAMASEPEAALLPPEALEALLAGSLGPLEELTDSVSLESATVKRAPSGPASVPTKILAAAGSASSTGAVLETDLDMTSPLTIRPAPARRRTTWIAAAVGVTALAGLLVWRPWAAPVRGHDGDRAPVPLEQQTSLPSTAAKPTRRVSVSIDPADAEIYLDGERATVTSGVLWFEAELGSVHSIRLRSGELTVDRDVVVSDHGAVPSALSLPRAVLTTPGPRPAVVPSPRQPFPVPKPLPAPEDAPLGIDPKFE